MMGVTLLEFLLARIAEDEAQLIVHRVGCYFIDNDTYGECDCGGEARLTAECAAKRAIVEWHQAWPVLVETPPTFEPQLTPDDMSTTTMRMSQQIMWATEQEYRKRFGTEPPAGPVLRILAAVYADHADYRDEWRPS